MRQQSLAPKDPEVRIATAISLLVLDQSGRFARELGATLIKPIIPTSESRTPPQAFDAIAFEVAAFCHYALMARYLGTPDDEDDELHNDDSYFPSLRLAAHLSGGVIESVSTPTLRENALVNRTLAYSMRARRPGILPSFESFLLSAIQRKALGAAAAGPLDMDLNTTLAVGLHARTFFAHIVPALAESAKHAVDKAEELGFYR